VLSDNQSIRAVCMTLSPLRWILAGTDGIPPQDYELRRLANGSMGHWSPARARAWELWMVVGGRLLLCSVSMANLGEVLPEPPSARLWH
jgi:hypothetical protein